jgi:hypothetical protein
VDRRAFPEIERELLYLFRKHQRGFISVGTIAETNELADFLNKSAARENQVESQRDFHKRFGKGSDRPSNVPSNPRAFYGLAWSEITRISLGQVHSLRNAPK